MTSFLVVLTTKGVLAPSGKVKRCTDLAKTGAALEKLLFIYISKHILDFLNVAAKYDWLQKRKHIILD